MGYSKAISFGGRATAYIRLVGDDKRRGDRIYGPPVDSCGSDRGDDDRAVASEDPSFQDLGCQKGTILRMGMPVDRISHII